MQKIPVHIVTGFLGAGKTTFLNHWLQQSQERLFIIENEVGQVNIDSKLVWRAAVDVIDLTSGCLCCSLQDELLEVLEVLSTRRHEFDRIIIETTGIAEPESVAYPFWASPAVAHVFDLQAIVCIADALYVDDALKDTEDARRQLAFADLILLNKIDLIPDAQRVKHMRMLKALNPYASIWQGEKGQFPIDALTRLHPLSAKRLAQQTAALAEEKDTHHHHDITSVTLRFDRAFDLERLGHELRVILEVNRHQIYRIKGLIRIQNYENQVVLQSVRNTVYLTDGMPWASAEDNNSYLVIIGKALKKEALTRIFQRHLVGAPIPPK